MSKLSQEARQSFDFLNIINSLRARSVPSVPEYKWKEILNDQDFDNYIFELREELIDRVFRDIHANYLNYERVKFVVECAYESWKKTVCLHFLFYDPCNECYNNISSWTPDLEPESCPPDAWSKGNIAMKKRELKIQKPEKIDTVLSDYQLIKLDELPQENQFSSVHIEKPIVKQDSLQELYVLDQDQGYSILNFPFTSNSLASSTEKFLGDIIINKMTSDSNITKVSSDRFYKKVRRKDMSLPSLDYDDLKITPQRKLSTHAPMEHQKRLSFPPLRLTAVSNVKRDSMPLPTVASGRLGKTVNFPSDDFTNSSLSVPHPSV